jgi:tRNA pseudouridine38-40 synthase
MKLLIEYDGTDYAGWQRQENARTIQGEIEDALRRITQQEVSLIGAGRTDAGVHARGQVANFQSGTRLPAPEIEHALNAMLPEDIVIRRAEEAPLDFHARYSARERCYSYSIRRVPSAMQRNFSWFVGYPLDVCLMEQSAAMLPSVREFGSFCKGQAEVDDYRCTVLSACWKEDGPSLVFVIRANRFLHGMVRSLVGTMVDVGRGYTTPGEFSSILSANDRREGGPNAPARGLTLESVRYEETVDDDHNRTEPAL